RFSEDMDFTIQPHMQDEISDQEIFNAFEETFEQISEITGMTFSIPIADIRPHAATNSMKFNIAYVGPLGGNGNSVKVDATRGEKLEFEVEFLNVIHDYDDLEEEGNITIQCYGLNEVIIEKMVALMGRTVPRDLYDFEYLTSEEGIEMQDIYGEFKSKAEHKAVTDKHLPEHFVKVVTEKKAKFEKAWDTNLKHQMKELSNFEEEFEIILSPKTYNEHLCQIVHQFQRLLRSSALHVLNFSYCSFSSAVTSNSCALLI
ncbi:MAG: putative nucleotidyltransferase component of viral defense system, partial [Arenicella sp.]